MNPQRPASQRRPGRGPESYQRALVIREQLAQADPTNASAQRDLAFRLQNVGDVQQASGDLAAARVNYQRALTIREQLAQADPTNTLAQRDLSVSYEQSRRCPASQRRPGRHAGDYRAGTDDLRSSPRPTQPTPTSSTT